jgi:hypothetical protein
MSIENASPAGAESLAALFDQLVEAVAQRVTAQLTGPVFEAQVKAALVNIDDRFLASRIEAGIDTWADLHMNDRIESWADYSLNDHLDRWASNNLDLSDDIERAVDNLDLSDKVREEIQNLTFNVTVE